MGRWGIEIGGAGPGDYAKDGLGDEAEGAINELLAKLKTLGLDVSFAAVMIPQAESVAPDASAKLVAVDEPGVAPAAAVVQLPVEDGAFKCPECGLTYAAAGVCVGGEYGHAAVTLQPTEQVLAAGADTTEDSTAAATTPAPPEATAAPPSPAEPAAPLVSPPNWPA